MEVVDERLVDDVLVVHDVLAVDDGLTVESFFVEVVHEVVFGVFLFWTAIGQVRVIVLLTTLLADIDRYRRMGRKK